MSWGPQLGAAPGSGPQGWWRGQHMLSVLTYACVEMEVSGGCQGQMGYGIMGEADGRM